MGHNKEYDYPPCKLVNGADLFSLSSGLRKFITKQKQVPKPSKTPKSATQG